MKDGATQRCIAMVCVVGTYGIYMVTTPDPADGLVFGYVLAAVAGLAGYDLAARKAKDV